EPLLGLQMPGWQASAPGAHTTLLCDGTPAVQMSVVHALLSLGTSLLSTSLTMLPAPSQSLRWQSPAVWLATGVPAIAHGKPQVPALHGGCAHSVIAPGQSLSIRQPVQWPAPSQMLLPPQLVPAVVGGLLGTPFVQTSLVHAFPSTGTSLLSTTET